MNIDFETRMKTREAAMKLYGQHKKPKLTLWQKIKLYFTPVQLGVDVGHGGDKSVWVAFKQVDGILVVVDQGEGDSWTTHLPNDTQQSTKK